LDLVGHRGIGGDDAVHDLFEDRTAGTLDAVVHAVARRGDVAVRVHDEPGAAADVLVGRPVVEQRARLVEDVAAPLCLQVDDGGPDQRGGALIGG